MTSLGLGEMSTPRYMYADWVIDVILSGTFVNVLNYLPSFSPLNEI